MVKYYSEQLDRTFFALSDPTRRAILSNLAAQERCTVMQLAQPFNMTLPAISKHLKLLEKSNLITREQRGRIHYLRFKPEPMHEANQWLTTYAQFWQSQLDSLEEYLTNNQEGETENDLNPTKHDAKHDSGST